MTPSGPSSGAVVVHDELPGPGGDRRGGRDDVDLAGLLIAQQRRQIGERRVAGACRCRWGAWSHRAVLSVAARKGRPGGVGASRRSDGTRRAGGARTYRPARAAKMFPGGHKDSAGEAGTNEPPRPGERSLAARRERSERPVAGTDAAAQTDRAGRHAVRRRTSPLAWQQANGLTTLR